MSFNNNAIGVFDSGLGGLTAVKELKRLLPNENIVYFGDIGRVPYGTRSFDIIKKYAKEGLDFLLSFNIKTALIACGTVSAIALDILQEESSVPIIGVVEPSARAACDAFMNTEKFKGQSPAKFALLATPAAVKNGAYERQLAKIFPNMQFSAKACPLFVPLVENGYIERGNPLTVLAAKEYLSALESFSPDILILGCTHYPIIKDIIADTALEYFKNFQIIDSGSAAAYSVKQMLQEKQMLNSSNKKGTLSFYVSDETYMFTQTAGVFLGEDFSKDLKVEKVTVGC